MEKGTGPAISSIPTRGDRVVVVEAGVAEWEVVTSSRLLLLGPELLSRCVINGPGGVGENKP